MVGGRRCEAWRKESWPAIKNMFQNILAKADGEIYCDWVGSSASGYYVKLVHKGIENRDMQTICEAHGSMNASSV